MTNLANEDGDLLPPPGHHPGRVLPAELAWLTSCPGFGVALRRKARRGYLSTLRAADVHAFVRSRMKFAWAVAILDTHSMSLEPGPRSSESAIVLSVDS
jgi:hypothetical protein